MKQKSTNPNFLNGVPELLILKLLSREPMHGYALVRSIGEATEQALQFGEGSIYPILHRLESEGSLEAREVLINGRSRLVYRVTRKGSLQLEASLDAWQRVVAAVEMAIHGGTDRERPIVAG